MNNRTLPVWMGMGILCWISLPATAQQTPIPLPEIIPLPSPSPTLPVPLPEASPLESGPFEIPSGVSPPSEVSPSVTVKEFIFTGNTVFSNEQLQAEVAEYKGRLLSAKDLYQIEQRITQVYVAAGYVSSGAFIDTQSNLDPQNPQQAIVTIQIIEGRVADIQISGAKRLEDYVRVRIEPATAGVLNEEEILAALRWLQRDALIKNIRGQLRSGPTVGDAVLDIAVDPRKPFQVELLINNDRSPSVGTLERGVSVEYANPSGLGDILNLSYRNTDGSHLAGLNYTIPINLDGRLSLSYLYGNSVIIETPFDQIDLQSTAQQFELSYHQPVLRKVKGRNIQELTLGAILSRFENQESLLDIPFPLSEAADNQGRTHATVLRFWQEWSSQGDKNFIAFRSQFNLGLPISSRNSELLGNGTFFVWEGQGLHAHRIQENFLWVTRARVQLSDGPVIPSEQFSLGGADTVRGYRKDGVTRDNGLYLSTELRIPLFSNDNSTLQLIPFGDLGYATNRTARLLPAENQVLAAVGLGLQFTLGDRLSAKVEYGIPLLNRSERRLTLQEEGFSFALTWRF